MIFPLYLKKLAGRLELGSVGNIPEAEEVLDFLVAGGGRDARDMNGTLVRHGERRVILFLWI